MNIFAQLILIENKELFETITKDKTTEKIANFSLGAIQELPDNEGKNIFLCIENNLKETLHYAEENFSLQSIVFIGKGNISQNVDIKDGDIIFCNTFVENENSIPFFLEQSVGENLDLNLFGLLLSGICKSGEISGDVEEYEADITDMHSYGILQFAEKKDLLKNMTVMHGVGENSIVGGNLKHIFDVTL